MEEEEVEKCHHWVWMDVIVRATCLKHVHHSKLLKLQDCIVIAHTSFFFVHKCALANKLGSALSFSANLHKLDTLWAILFFFCRAFAIIQSVSQLQQQQQH